MKSAATIHRNRLYSYLQDSLVWFIPAAIIISTFLILFFSLSEHIAGVKTTNAYLVTETKGLRERVKKLEEGKVTFTSNVPGNAQTATVIREFDGVRSVKVSTQNIEVTNQLYWGFAYPAAKETQNIAATSVVKSSDQNCKCLVLNYELTDANKIPNIFELFAYDSQSKNLMLDGATYDKVIVLINGKLALYNDFRDNNAASLKPSLTVLQASNIDAKIKSAIATELAK
jgi:hypothetical protein